MHPVASCIVRILPPYIQSLLLGHRDNCVRLFPPSIDHRCTYFLFLAGSAGPGPLPQIVDSVSSSSPLGRANVFSSSSSLSTPPIISGVLPRPLFVLARASPFTSSSSRTCVLYPPHSHPDNISSRFPPISPHASRPRYPTFLRDSAINCGW